MGPLAGPHILITVAPGGFPSTQEHAKCVAARIWLSPDQEYPPHPSSQGENGFRVEYQLGSCGMHGYTSAITGCYVP